MTALPPILIVDDAADDTLILKRLFLKAGVKNELVTFTDPKDACDYLARCAEQGGAGLPVVVFTDLLMRSMDGIAFTVWVRSQAIGAGLPVVMVTGWGHPEDHERAMKAGVMELILKFPKPAALADVVQKYGGTVATCKFKTLKP